MVLKRRAEVAATSRADDRYGRPDHPGRSRRSVLAHPGPGQTAAARTLPTGGLIRSRSENNCRPAGLTASWRASWSWPPRQSALREVGNARSWSALQPDPVIIDRLEEASNAHCAWASVTWEASVSANGPVQPVVILGRQELKHRGPRQLPGPAVSDRCRCYQVPPVR